MTLLEAIKSIYARHGAGCCCHIVLDDDSCDDSCVALAYETALGEGHDDCIAAAEHLFRMSEPEREVALGNAKDLSAWGEPV